MKGFFLVFAVTLIFLLLEESLAEEQTCKQVVSGITKRMMDGIATCTKEAKYKNGKEKQAKQMCSIKCTLKKEKLLDDKGQFPMSLLEAFVERECPPHLASMKDKTREVYGKCVEVAAASNMDPTEEFCKSYEPLVKCAMAATAQLCN